MNNGHFSSANCPAASTGQKLRDVCLPNPNIHLLSSFHFKPTHFLLRFNIQTKTHHRLSVAVLPSHRQVQPEKIAVDDVHVASLRSSQGVDPPVERLVRPHLHRDLGVLAVHRNWKPTIVSFFEPNRFSVTYRRSRSRSCRSSRPIWSGCLGSGLRWRRRRPAGCCPTGIRIARVRILENSDKITNLIEKFPQHSPVC